MGVMGGKVKEKLMNSVCFQPFCMENETESRNHVLNTMHVTVKLCTIYAHRERRLRLK